MNDETKEKIKVVLELLRHTLIENGVSMGSSGKNCYFLAQITMWLLENLMDSVWKWRVW